MKNPWEEISSQDYENHMKLDSVRQLQAMNEMMKDQLRSCSAASVMILGIAGGNGLEHIEGNMFDKIYGVDVNEEYLAEVRRRYPRLEGRLECLCLDLLKDSSRLPWADLVIANLLIEYIGYACFQKVLLQVKPTCVSCAIQINTSKEWVSDSPYLHVFDGLEQVHHQIEADGLKKAMDEKGYSSVGTVEYPLPNGKKLMRRDFVRDGERAAV